MISEFTIPIHGDGIELLEEVARQTENTTGLLFHGSSQVINLLKPRPVYWKDSNGKLYDDSKRPVICASEEPFIHPPQYTAGRPWMKHLRSLLL